jgi:hypothetical protein
MGVRDWLKDRRTRNALLMLLLGLIVAVAAGFLTGNWFVAVIIALLVILAVLVISLLRTVISEEREERLDRGYHDAPAEEAPRERGDLRASFRQSLAELKASRLGRDGIHALPWYLVIGDRAAGKSALLGASGLELPAEFAHVARGGATRDCDWWFTNEAVFLDTAGRLTESDGDDDRAQWQTLLKEIHKARPGRALDGVIVALSADRLLGRGSGELEEEARVLRRRLNEITDGLALDAPIYVVVTKADLIDGFVDFMACLPTGRHTEAFGWTNPQRNFPDAGDLVTRALEPLRDRLESLVPEMVLREVDPARRRRLLLFPHEFAALSAALTAFVRATFAPSVYEETPFLRGVYLTSARRGGSCVSTTLTRLGQEWARGRYEASQDAGLFLRDLFREIVIGDRELALSIGTLGPRARRAILLAAAGVAGVAVIGWGAAAYRIFEHQRVIADAAQRALDAPSELENIERLRAALVAAEGLSAPERLGLGPGLDRALERGQEVFIDTFTSEFEEHAKAKLKADANQLDAVAFQAVAELALDLTWLQSRGEAAEGFRPNLAAYAPRLGRSEVDRAAFTDCYDDFVRWAPLSELEERIVSERRTLTNRSQKVLSLKYLEDWGQANEALRPPVRYADLGLPSPRGGARDHVQTAYTRATWETLVKGLLTGIRETKGAPEKNIRHFERAYVEKYDIAWAQFVLNVPTDPRPDPSVKESPYLGFLQRVHQEVEADLPRGAEPAPKWQAQLAEVLRTEPLAPLEEKEDDEDEEKEEELPPWDRYLVALDLVAGDVEVAQSSPEDALTAAQAVATSDDTSFDLAIDEILQIVPKRGDPVMTRKLREILEAPVIDGLLVVLREATGQIDQAWRDIIVDNYSRSLSQAEHDALYKEGGDLSIFEQDYLGPFYANGRVKPVLRELGMPFGPKFLAWLDSAKKVQQVVRGGAPTIAIRLVGKPATVRGSGRLYVKDRTLRIECSRLHNFEYRPHRAHSFDWDTTCSDVQLRVTVIDNGVERDLPVRDWRGPLAVPDFFQAARRDGSAFFWRVRDRDRGIEVDVPYELRSGQEILSVSHRNPPRSVRN